MSMPSLAEENYLKAIYHLSGGGEKAVMTNEIAEAMSNKAASVTDMVKKLSAKNLVTYEKYYGVKITSKGKTSALLVIRKHRLWETFLVEKLGFTWDQVHDVAEQLEHIRSPHLIEKLDEFLGFPETDPHGDAIPDSKGRIKAKPKVALFDQKIGYKGTIAAVKDSDSNLLIYLNKIGATPGKKILIIGKEPYDQSMEISLNNEQIFLSKEVSQNILVSG